MKKFRTEYNTHLEYIEAKNQINKIIDDLLIQFGVEPNIDKDGFDWSPKEPDQTYIIDRLKNLDRLNKMNRINK